MAKIEIPAVPSGFATTAALNARLQQIEDEFNNKVLYRADTGIEPNTMQDILDMGDNRIHNLLAGVQNKDAVNLEQVLTLVGGGEAFALQSYSVDIFAGNGVTDTFALTGLPLSVNSIDIAIGGISQVPGIDYTLDGQNVIFSVAPPDEVTIVCKYGRPLSVGMTDSAESKFIASGVNAVERYAQDKMREYVSAEDFGAVGNSVTDDTAAIQAAIDALSRSTSKVKTLLLGACGYNIEGTLVVSAPIQIIGQGVYDLENTRGITRPQGGSWLIHSNTGGPLISYTSNLGKGARLAKVGIFEPDHPTPGPGWTPTVYDWCIRNENTQGTLHLEDVHFHNVYRGVLTDFAVRPRYRGITGQFFNRGFTFDRIYDTGSFESLHAWTYWSEHEDVLAYTQINSLSITFLRTDGMWLGNIFTFGVDTSIYFATSTFGGTGRVITIANLYSDFCRRALVIDATAAHVQVAAMFHLGQAWPASPTTALGGSCAVHVASGTNSLIQIGGLYGVLCEGAAVKVEGSANQVWIGSEAIEQYDYAATGQGAHLITDVTSSVKLAAEPHLYKYGGGTPAIITAASTGTIEAQTTQKFVGANSVNKVVTAAGAAGSAGVVTIEGEVNAPLSVIASGTGFVQLGSATNALSFYGGASAVKGTLTGAKAGNAALANLITYLAARGLLTDSTT